MNTIAINPIVTEFLEHVDELTLDDLNHLIDSVKDEQRARRADEIKATLARLASLGVSADEIAAVAKPGASKPVAEKIKVAPKYRHPENPSLQWSGRGNPPGWVKDLDSKNVSRDSYKIKPEESE
jgi:DNA-binding protein H-NS